MSLVIKGCIIRPNGDVTEKHLSRFADKYVVPTDPIFQDAKPPAMSVLLELPILVARLNPVDMIPGDSYHTNRPATCLNVGPCGFAPMEWQRKVGVVLVVRMDRRPLCCFHLEALWKFHWTLLEASNTLGWDNRYKIRARVSRSGFEEFWFDYKKKQIEAGREDWGDLPSPYDIGKE
jgi:hypothetical protein